MFITTIIAFVLQTPMLLVREVRVKGLRFTTRDRVERLAKRALGKNIILFPTGEISRSIAKIPEVSRVSLDRVFPDTVEICIVERRPFAVLLHDSQVYLVQHNRFVFHQAKGIPQGFPVIEVADPGSVRVGQRCELDGLCVGIRVINSARKKELTISKVSIDRLGDICLNMCNGLRVRLGQSENLNEKMSVIRTALICKPGLTREALILDVTCPRFPVYRPRSSGA
ncbi:MAG: cell division protein FtsQ/DivIB [Armatimonadota bacterium]